MNKVKIPGLCDVHVHFREPGFSYKETIKTGSIAAARGGYTDVCTMPNLNPVPDNIQNLMTQINIINKDAAINVHPYGSISVSEEGKELADLNNLKDFVVGFSDDGRGIQNEKFMLKAFEEIKKTGKILVAHCEDDVLKAGGYIHAGEYAKRNNHKGIVSESEWKPIERDVELAKKTGCKYHVCHISTKESVEIIRQAKRDGVDISCETAPHYLLLDDSMLKESGNFKMNPPIRSIEDRNALIEGIIDGTIDIIATDHAPHSIEEKSKGLKDSPFGIVGIETAFQLLYTNLVLKNVITINKLLDLMCFNPRKRFNIPLGNSYSLWDLDKEIIIDSNKFLSKGKSTPFDRNKFYGECLETVCNGKIAYKKEWYE